MSVEFNKDLCEEVHKNLTYKILDLQTQIDRLRGTISFFNVTGIGILVAIVTGLILNHTGAK
jgi:hypothetical protein